MERYTELMVDKGFNISNECAAKRIYDVVLPGKRRSSQMLLWEVTKINKIAKTRILVEQVIRGLKVFRFIANEVSINMFSYIDDILQICPAISICKAPFMGRNLDWNKTKMVTDIYIYIYIYTYIYVYIDR